MFVLFCVFFFEKKIFIFFFLKTIIMHFSKTAVGVATIHRFLPLE